MLARNPLAKCSMCVIAVAMAAALMTGSRPVVAQDKKDIPKDVTNDVKLITSMTAEETGAFLTRQGIEFKKAEPKKGISLFDFQRKGVNIRLYNYDGKDLMLDAAFNKMPLDRVNEWNRAAKFTRAVLQSSPKGDFTTLESNLDLIGGVSEGGLKQFLLNFDDEARVFAKLAGDGASDDQLYAPVTAARIEGVFKSLGIEYERKDLPDNAGALYDFEVAKFKIRLVNFAGKDLMLDAHFKKLPLDDINQWNLNTKFIRAVSYNIRKTEYSSLESNLDCEAGITDGILRNFIVGFQEDVKQFAKYVQGK